MAHDNEIQRLLKENALLRSALEAKEEVKDPPLHPIAWLLVWMEYARRKRWFQFLGQDALRAKTDAEGRRWNVYARMPIANEAIDASAKELFVALGEAMEYDPYNPPHEDYIYVKCERDKGMADTANVEMDRIESALPRQLNMLQNAYRALNNAKARNQQSTIVSQIAIIDELKREILDAKQRYEQGIEIVEGTFVDHYVIPVESLEKAEIYGMSIKVMTAMLLPGKKRSLNIPQNILGGTFEEAGSKPMITPEGRPVEVPA